MKCESGKVRRTSMRLLAVICLVAALGACARDPRLDALRTMEQPTPSGPSPERIRELKDAIAEYGDVVSAKVEAALKQASYLKLLAQEYMRAQLYGPALEALEEAIYIEPRNQVLHQLAGVSASFVAKATVNAAERARYFAMAESYYRSSIEIDPGYQDGLYALGNLYHFELGRHLDAIDVLEDLLDRAPSHVQGMFVLARAHAALGHVDEAAEMYGRIMETSGDRDVVERARRNRQLLLGDAK